MFEELDYQETPLGNISLRRRTEPRLDNIVIYEVKLNDEFLMSSLFTTSEQQLAELGLAALKQNGLTEQLDIVVGGLGLGYTAATTLQDSAVQSLLVIDVMQPVISWHQRGLVPAAEKIINDPRCTLREADFFAVVMMTDTGFYQTEPAKKAHALLLDIDHSPSHWLNPGNAGFYTLAGLSSLKEKLHSGGIFALWSNDPPDDVFLGLLEQEFSRAEAHIVTFPNPYTDVDASSTVYIAHN